VTHKTAPALKQQIEQNKKVLHLSAFLQGKQPENTYCDPTNVILEAAQYDLKQKVSKNAPTKTHKEFARLRSATARQKTFHTVGLSRPNLTKAQLKQKYR
jgi:EAL domain-containing protein (putative c-di-GMP-specific phosphodiesterase class I)